MKIAKDSVVTIHYTLTNDAGEIIDSSIDAEPLLYLQGHNNMVPGLESALAGSSAGEKKQVSLSPLEGYGEKRSRQVSKNATRNVRRKYRY